MLMFQIDRAVTKFLQHYAVLLPGRRAPLKVCTGYPSLLQTQKIEMPTQRPSMRHIREVLRLHYSVGKFNTPLPAASAWP